MSSEPSPEQLVQSAWQRVQQQEMSRRLRTTLLQSVFFVALIICWQLAATADIWEAALFPTPAEVLAATQRGVADGSLFSAIAASLQRLLLGYLFSLGVGTLLGVMMGRLQLLNATLGSLSLGLQALPSICWLPLAILWFGLSESAMFFVVVMGSLMAVVLAVRDGVRSIPPLYLRAARVMGANGWRLYLFIILPASLPAMLTGARLGWSFAWRSLMAAELLYVSAGLGSTLMMGRELHDMALVVSTMLIIVAIGLFFDRVIFGTLEKFLGARWGF